MQGLSKLVSSQGTQDQRERSHEEPNHSCAARVDEERRGNGLAYGGSTKEDLYKIRLLERLKRRRARLEKELRLTRCLLELQQEVYQLDVTDSSEGNSE